MPVFTKTYRKSLDFYFYQHNSCKKFSIWMNLYLNSIVKIDLALLKKSQFEILEDFPQIILLQNFKLTFFQMRKIDFYLKPVLSSGDLLFLNGPSQKKIHIDLSFDTLSRVLCGTLASLINCLPQFSDDHDIHHRYRNYWYYSEPTKIIQNQPYKLDLKQIFLKRKIHSDTSTILY